MQQLLTGKRRVKDLTMIEMDQPMYNSNPKVQKMLTLGKPTIFKSERWPDYVSEYGFTTDDVPALVALYADTTIDTLPQNNPAEWAPVYAWRILGLLRDEAAILPLIQGFDRLCHDDTALSELALVFALLGPAAIPALEQHWLQPNEDQFSHILAMDALYEIAALHPASRDAVMAIYRRYMGQPTISATALNGLLMGRLMDLEAIELIAEIRQLFALNCVDIGCAGDLEDVEMALGFRTQRSTPTPRYVHMEGLEELFGDYSARVGDDPDDEDDFDDTEDTDSRPNAIFDVLEDYLLGYGCDASILGISELDGFFAALGCAPVNIMPSTWMPAMWGGEEFMPEWDHEFELEEFTNAIFQHYNGVMQDFLNHEYEPLFVESSIHSTEFLQVDDWCEGFLRGLQLWGTISPDDAEQLERWIFPIRQFGTEEGHVVLASMTEPEIVQLQNRISPNVEKIRRHFFKPVKRADTTFVHTAPKIGRNDPCPCGSGKKYKKCCGVH